MGAQAARATSNLALTLSMEAAFPIGPVAPMLEIGGAPPLTITVVQCTSATQGSRLRRRRTAAAQTLRKCFESFRPWPW